MKHKIIFLFFYFFSVPIALMSMENNVVTYSSEKADTKSEVVTYDFKELTRFFRGCDNELIGKKDFQEVFKTMDLLFLRGENGKNFESFMGDNTRNVRSVLNAMDNITVLNNLLYLDQYKDNQYLDQYKDNQYKDIWKVALLNMVPAYIYLEKIYKKISNQALQRSFQENLKKTIEVVKKFETPNYKRLFQLIEVQDNTCPEYFVAFCKKSISPEALAVHNEDPIVKMHMIFHIIHNAFSIKKEEFCPQNYLSDIIQKYEIDITKCVSRAGNTLLHLGVMKGCLDVVLYLLTTYNLGVQSVNNEGKTVYAFAYEVDKNCKDRISKLDTEITKIKELYKNPSSQSFISPAFVKNYSSLCEAEGQYVDLLNDYNSENNQQFFITESDFIQRKKELLQNNENIQKIIALIKEKL